jgi:iron complex transport system substrate-binding protein
VNKKLLIIFCLISCIFIFGCSNSHKLDSSKSDVETITVTDCIGRKVEVPKEVKKIGCLYAFSGHAVTMLGRGEDIAAVSNGLKRDKMLLTMCPSINEALRPKVNGVINIEELAKANPDVVFVDGDMARNEGEVEKFNKFKIPFLVVEYKNIEEQKYAVKMIGKVVGNLDKAVGYEEYYDNCIEKVSSMVKDIPKEQRMRLYHSVNEASRTDAKDTLPAEWTEISGAVNVSVNDKLKFVDNKYFASLEQILLWNPDVIIVNEEGVDEYIINNEQWENIKAVKNDRVYKMPNGVSRWGHPGSIETPLAILWTAKKLYPEYTEEINLEKEVKNFYSEFFNYDLSDDDIKNILSGNGMRKSKNLKGGLNYMKVLICIDDTDNMESVGTGELAEMLAKNIEENQWGECSRITRHQLLIHKDIPYTSHNSSMCFKAEIKEENFQHIIKYASNFLAAESAEGSDPGLCVVDLDTLKEDKKLKEFGDKAKKHVLTKEDAYDLAKNLNIHLSEHGGTGQGVVGALAGTGLRLSGNDGRFKGKFKLDSLDKFIKVDQLCLNKNIDLVMSIDGKILKNKEVVMVGDTLKTVLLDDKSVLLVYKDDNSEYNNIWNTCSKQQLKKY